MKFLKLLFLYIGLTSLFVACSDDKVINAAIRPAKQTFVFAQAGGLEETEVESTTDWRVSIPSEATEWCKASRLAELLRISVGENVDSDERSVTLNLYSDGMTVPVKVEQLGTNPAMKLDRKTLNVSGNVLAGAVKVVSNIEYKVKPNDGWITVRNEPETRGVIQTKEVVFLFEKNSTGKKRIGSVRFEPTDEAYKKLALTLQVVQGVTPIDASEIKDIQFEIVNAEANQQEKNQTWGKQDIMASCDGDMSTFYHSPWNSGKTQLPVELTYYLKEASDVDYLIYTPRQDSDNGAWGKIKVSFKTDALDFIDEEIFDLGMQPKKPRKIEFKNTHAGVTAIRISVETGKGGLVTCTELGVYQKNSAITTELEKIFADKLCTVLKEGIGEKEISEIKSPFLKNLAEVLYKGGYDAYHRDFRIQEYVAYRPVNDLASELKTGGYNPFENPTGIFFKPDEDIVLFVEDTHNEQISLKVYDFYNKSMGEKRETEVFPLYSGINVYKTKNGGLAYLDYYTKNYASVAPIKMHIVSGQVNGYFEKGKHDPNNWQKIINEAEYGHFDLKGEKVNLCFPVSEEGGLRQYCKNPEALIDVYDTYIGMEHELMGIHKYNRTFTNHMFIRTVPGSPGAAAYADGWGVGVYNRDTDGFNDATCKYKKLWMITHEFGHVNQVRPDLEWVGTTEVTNNCYAVCIRHETTPWWEKFEDESHNDGRGRSVPGGLINAIINQKVVKNMAGKTALWNAAGEDPFAKLLPLWQLLSYYRYVKEEYKDWYADLIEEMRKKNSNNKTQGELQVQFMTMTADILKVDLSEFFENAGMLKPCNENIDDYNVQNLKITEAQCQIAQQSMQRYEKPKAMLNYMSANAIRIFKEQAAMQGTYGEGVVVGNQIRTIQHNVWKNVIAFETYKGSELTHVAVMGTGIASSTGYADVKKLPIPEKASTEVYYPVGSTAIYAVSWDGKRMLVYGDSNGVENK